MIEDKEILSGKKCKYCGRPTELVASSEIRRNRKGKSYLCRNCNAYVSCHPGSEMSMGCVADFNLRRLRHEAHLWFDPIWKNKLKKSRYNAYSWLSLRLKMNKNYTHMGYFDEEDCMKVINICRQYLRLHAPHLIIK